MQSSVAANEESFSCSVLLWCSLHLSFVSSLCMCLFFLLLCLFFLSFSLSRHPVHCVGFGHSFAPKADKTTQTSLNCNPQCAHTHAHILHSVNHSQEMGSHANEARLATGTQDEVSGLEMFFCGGNMDMGSLFFCSISFCSLVLFYEFPLLLTLFFFHSAFECINFAVKHQPV